MLPYALILKMNKIKCPKHACPLSHVDLSKISQDGTRIICKECAIIEGSATKLEFDEICKKVLNSQQSAIEEIKNTFEQINHQIEAIKQTIKQVFQGFDQQDLKQVLQKAFSSQEANYGLKEFEILAETMARHKELIEMNDQKQAESQKYIDVGKKLVKLIERFSIENNLGDNLTEVQQLQLQLKQEVKNNNQKKIENILSEKIVTKGFSHITKLQLNYNETVLAAQFIETINYLQIWALNPQTKQWVRNSVLQCHGESLIDFQFSKISNSLITTGLDQTERKQGICNQQTFSIKEWDWLDGSVFFQEVNKIYEINNARIQCISQNSTQSFTVACLGGSIIIFSFRNNQYIQELKRQISSEIISAINFCNDESSFGVGTYDSKFYICSFLDTKFKILQQMKLNGIPKQIIFGNDDLELFILIKDGVLSINIRENLESKFNEIQRIVNNIEKIRAIQLNQQLSVLAIGGETNILQLWKKNDNMQWKCQSQFQQDNFINCICFSHQHNQIITSNSSEICIHRQE